MHYPTKTHLTRSAKKLSDSLHVTPSDNFLSSPSLPLESCTPLLIQDNFQSELDMLDVTDDELLDFSVPFFLSQPSKQPSLSVIFDEQPELHHDSSTLL